MANFDSLSNIVFSTDGGRVAKESPQVVGSSAFSDGIVRIKRETKGRKGKGVTTIAGIEADHSELKRIAGILKKHCGSGGAIKEGIIEIQGDKRDVIKLQLEKLGYQIKFAGG
ncbi:MAG: translation initiation factor 1 [Alteromonadaceae bacterium]|jgi:translation initiation factor 1